MSQSGGSDSPKSGFVSGIVLGIVASFSIFLRFDVRLFASVLCKGLLDCDDCVLTGVGKEFSSDSVTAVSASSSLLSGGLFTSSSTSAMLAAESISEATATAAVLSVERLLCATN